MKIKCVDGESRDFYFIRDRLLRFGFDPVLLDKDDNIISLSIPPNIGIIEALRLTVDGAIFPLYIYHWSKKNKKINPVSMPLESILEDVKWLSFLPSIEIDKETSLHGRQDALTSFTRFLTKIFRLVLNRKDQPSFRTMIFGLNTSKFKFNYGYKVLGLDYIESAKEYFLVLSDDEVGPILVHPSLLGYTNKVLASP